MLTLSANAQQYKDITVDDAPFDMGVIHEMVYPDRSFYITRYGAKGDGSRLCTKAINNAIRACSKAGGGHVVVPKGEWLTGAIHLMSNVDLHLEDGARLVFTDNPADYLPAVMTTWEGVECYNYSPLIYAYNCQNIKISGHGGLYPKMELWKQWFKRPQPHLDATKMLYTWCSELTPLSQRRLTDLPESNMRPHLIQLNRCRNVVLEDFKIRNSPFWTIHMYMCDEGIVRGLDVYAHGHNNDGIDIDMSSRFLIERCTFNQGDDAVVIKAGRNQDAWRLNKPSENIVIRNCNIIDGHVLLGIGSEMSGGVQNVWMHDCKTDGRILAACYIKTNHRRGGFVRNIYLDNAHMKSAKRLIAVDTDVLYQWKDFPDYETRITDIDGFYISNVECDSCEVAIDINGDQRKPIRNVRLQNIHVGKVSRYFSKIVNATGVILDDVSLK